MVRMAVTYSKTPRFGKPIGKIFKPEGQNQEKRRQVNLQYQRSI